MTPLEEVNELLQTDTDLSLLTAHIDTVVIVDDSEINIAILTEQLKMCNVNVISFLSGKACIDFCQTNDAFDVILMDMMMPNMSGIDASRALREMGISQPIIAISAANEQFKVKFTDVVNNLTLIQDELNKPFTALSISKSLNAVCQ
jgi:two-component system alkaline phosphatase synthesis response regulator PhoP